MTVLCGQEAAEFAVRRLGGKRVTVNQAHKFLKKRGACMNKNNLLKALNKLSQQKILIKDRTYRPHRNIYSLRGN